MLRLKTHRLAAEQAGRLLASRLFLPMVANLEKYVQKPALEREVAKTNPVVLIHSGKPDYPAPTAVLLVALVML